MKILNIKKTLLTVASATLIGFSGMALNTAAIAADGARERLNTFFTEVSSIKGSFSHLPLQLI